MAQLEKLDVTKTKFCFTQMEVSLLKSKHSVMQLRNGME